MTGFAVTILGRSWLLWGRWTPDLRAHEGMHRLRQRRAGGWRWLWRYCTSRRFRLCEEALAYAASVEHGADLDTCARLLARWYLLGPWTRLWRLDEAQAKAAILEVL